MDATVDGARVGFAGLAADGCHDWLLEPGDIPFSHINSVVHVGKCAVYRGEPQKLVHGMNLLYLRSDTPKLLPEFAKSLMRGNEFRAGLSNFINKAVNQASVSIGNLKTIPVTVAPLAEQRRIAEVLDRAEALRAKRRAALAQLDTLTPLSVTGHAKVPFSSRFVISHSPAPSKQIARPRVRLALQKRKIAPGQNGRFTPHTRHPHDGWSIFTCSRTFG